MILYSIQPLSIWVDIKTHGRFCADLDRSTLLHNRNGKLDFEQGLYAYKWMIKQYKKRTGHNIKTAIWCWKKYNGKADLFNIGMHKYSDNQAMIKMDVPDDLVLLSNFEDWNSCLNYDYIGETEEDTEGFYGWCDMLKGDDHNQMVTDSWKCIFQVDHAKYIQAIIPYIDKKWIKEAQIRRTNHQTKTLKIS